MDTIQNPWFVFLILFFEQAEVSVAEYGHDFAIGGCDQMHAIHIFKHWTKIGILIYFFMTNAVVNRMAVKLFTAKT